jgi:hypothetical protein
MKPYRLLFTVLMLFTTYLVKAQTTCSGCTITINGPDSGSYTVASGQTLCIAAGAVFTGTLIVNGGTVCNLGEMLPDTFLLNQGTFLNSGLITVKKNLLIHSGVVFNNQTTGVMTLLGHLSFAANNAQFINAGTLTTTGNITVGSGTFTHTGVINCRHLYGNTSQNGTGAINQTNPN